MSTITAVSVPVAEVRDLRAYGADASKVGASPDPQDTYTPARDLGPVRGAGDPPDYLAGFVGLDHNERVCRADIDQLKLSGPCGQWDGARILNTVGQLDTDSDTASDESRCAPSSILAGAVMDGREATGALTHRLADQVDIPVLKAELAELESRIADGSATTGDLHRVQELIYDHYHTGPGNGMNGSEIQRAEQELAGGMTPTARTATAFSPSRVPLLLDAMEAGDSYTSVIDVNGSGNDLNHAVQIGKDGAGRAYAYDPYPQADHPYVMYQDSDPEGFERYVDGSLGFQGQNVMVGGLQSYH